MKTIIRSTKHHPILELACTSVSALYPLVATLVNQLQGDGLRVALVERNCELQPIEKGLIAVGTDTFLSGSDGVTGFYHSYQGGNNVPFIESLVNRYDLILLLGDGNSHWEKVWFLTKEEMRSAQVSLKEGNVFSINERSETIYRCVRNMAEEFWAATPLWACVLIGGQSSRMGTPKHLIKDGRGLSWLERTVSLLEEYTDNIVLAGKGEVPEALTGLSRIPDVPGLAGPMAGLLSAMRWQPDISWLLVACDMPSVHPEALHWLKAQKKMGDWAVVPKQRRQKFSEPLLALYDFRCAPLYEQLRIEGCLRIGAIASHEKIINPIIPGEIQDSWKNVNTPEELKSHRNKSNPDYSS